jgi:ribonuclease III
LRGELPPLGYVFRDPALARTALTHRSAGAGHNERFEFLGDAVLGFLAAELLLEYRPGAREGELSRLRARLVRRETLAQQARALGLGDALTLGPGERKSGGARRDSILADAFEALVCAIYLDGGLGAARAFVQRCFEPLLATLPPDEEALKDPKTRLQELLQARGQALPEYRLLAAREPPGRTPTFEVECRLDSGESASGRGASRRWAEQDAAARVLETLHR